jgi:hypothetical protein
MLKEIPGMDAKKHLSRTRFADSATTPAIVVAKTKSDVRAKVKSRAAAVTSAS